MIVQLKIVVMRLKTIEGNAVQVCLDERKQRRHDAAQERVKQSVPARREIALALGITLRKTRFIKHELRIVKELPVQLEHLVQEANLRVVNNERLQLDVRPSHDGILVTREDVPHDT